MLAQDAGWRVTQTSQADNFFFSLDGEGMTRPTPPLIG